MEVLLILTLLRLVLDFRRRGLQQLRYRWRQRWSNSTVYYSAYFHWVCQKHLLLLLQLVSCGCCSGRHGVFDDGGEILVMRCQRTVVDQWHFQQPLGRCDQRHNAHGNTYKHGSTCRIYGRLFICLGMCAGMHIYILLAWLLLIVQNHWTRKINYEKFTEVYLCVRRVKILEK